MILSTSQQLAQLSDRGAVRLTRAVDHDHDVSGYLIEFSAGQVHLQRWSRDFSLAVLKLWQSVQVKGLI